MKRAFLSIVCCFFILAITSPTYGDITGNWYIYGKLQIKAKATGYKAQRYTFMAYDMLEFHGDHTFFMQIAGIDGVWSQTGKRWIITAIDYSDIEVYFEDFFWNYYGYNISVNVDAVTASGSEAKGKIKGKITIKANFIDLDYGVPGSATVRYSFSGVPSLSAQALSSDNTPSLKQAIKDSLEEVIQSIRK